MNSYAAIILAAGYSRRMERFKPLLPIGGTTLVDRLISTFLDTNVEVYVVVGYRADEIRAAIEDRNVVVVENPNYNLGMFTSVQAGVRSLVSGYDAFFVMPADVPLVGPFTIESLMTASAQHRGRIIYPVFEKRRGHPPLIPMSLAPKITASGNDHSLRDVLHSFERLALEVNVPDSGILLDIDTPDDYDSLVKRLQ